MRFILLGINVLVLILLGMYLLNLFEIRSYPTETFVFLFMSGIVALFLSNEIIDNYGVSNPSIFLLPGIVAVLSPIIIKKAYSPVIILGWLLLVPGLVLLLRKIIRKEG